MDADGLPIVGTGIDFTKVGAIHQKRTLAFLNHFISHTVRFLNRFSCVCEEKLETLTVRLQRLETTMSILEAKLGSIPGLEDVTVPTSSSDTPSATPATYSSTTSASQSGTSAPATDGPTPAPPATTQEEPQVEEKPQMTVSQDPRYVKFFKMLQVGVPMQAIKLRAAAEGLDPELLETPDAPAPLEEKKTEKGDSEAEFSSDDKEADSDDDDDSSGFSD